MTACPACGCAHAPIPEACLYRGRPRESESERGVRHGERPECDDVRRCTVHQSDVTVGASPPDGHCLFHTVCQQLGLAAWDGSSEEGKMAGVMALRSELADFVRDNLEMSLCPGGHSIMAIVADGQYGSVETYLERLRSGVYLHGTGHEGTSLELRLVSVRYGCAIEVFVPLPNRLRYRRLVVGPMKERPPLDLHFNGMHPIGQSQRCGAGGQNALR